MTPTIDQTDRDEPRACACKAWSLCSKCARDLQLWRYEVELAEWAEFFGTPLYGGREVGKA